MSDEVNKPTDEEKRKLAREKIEKDVTWVMERCPKLNSLSVLEPTAQAIAIMLSVCEADGYIPFNDQEIAKLSLVGLIAMHCRQLDEEKFQTISPYAYIQVANYCMDPEDVFGKKYEELISKLHTISLDPFRP